MRTCGVPGCKGVLSLPGSKVHKLPDHQPQRGQWIKAVPQLNESKVKTPSICALHFTPSDYGKNRKYLKPSAVPSRHLKLNLRPEGSYDANVEENIPVPDIIQNTQFGKCESQDCQKIFIAAKSLSTQNQCLAKHIKALEKKVQHLEAELKKGSGSSGNYPCAAGDKNDFMLGPTQWRCITNRTTKGRNWTPEERSKANRLKTLCNTKCYNYIRKNIVPLPLPTELGSKDTEFKNEVPENERDYQKIETFVVKSEEENGSRASEEGEVHIVVPPEFQEFLVLQSIPD